MRAAQEKQDWKDWKRDENKPGCDFMQVSEREVSVCSHRELWNVNCDSKAPQHKAGELGFQTPTSTCQPSTNSHLVSMDPCTRSSKDNSNVALHSKVHESQGKRNLDNVEVLCTGSALSSITSDRTSVGERAPLLSRGNLLFFNLILFLLQCS